MTFVQNKDGVFSEYDDDYEIVIHCETEEEQKKIIEHLKSISWIPASADVMIWTVMNTQRSVKIMRLIDADAMNEELFYKQVGGKDSLITAESAFKMIDAQPTAYDVEAVVEQLDTYITKLVGRNAALYQTVMQIAKGGGVK